MNYFITGGSRGLGKAIVLQAVEEGHNVAFSYVNNIEAANKVISQAKEIRSESRVLSYQLDVTNSTQVEAVVYEILDEFENIDVVVNNAGINQDNLVANMSDEEWNAVISANLTGPFYVCRQVLPSMLSRRFGRIINISSLQCRGGKGQANYAASKAGLNGFTQSLAKEYGRKGINSNVVVPGFFKTDMTEDTMPQHQKDYWAKFCPQPDGRMGELPELGKVVTFLASEGGNYINGEIINVSGGIFMTL